MAELYSKLDIAGVRGWFYEQCFRETFICFHGSDLHMRISHLVSVSS
jgi:hypothetical protein